MRFFVLSVSCSETKRLDRSGVGEDDGFLIQIQSNNLGVTLIFGHVILFSNFSLHWMLSNRRYAKLGILSHEKLLAFTRLTLAYLVIGIGDTFVVNKAILN